MNSNIKKFKLKCVTALAILPIVTLSLPNIVLGQTSKSEGNADKDVLLDLSLADLETMEVTTTAATKSVAISIDEAPSIIYIITREDIDTYGYRTIGEALASIPGLFVIDDLVTSNVGIRGINGGADSWSRIMKFMIDGKSAHYYSSGGVLLGPEFIPMSSVESIEVIGGPGSAMYGANAFLGVVNVNTRKPEDGLHARVEGEAGMIRSNVGGGGQALATAKVFEKYPLSVTTAFSMEHYDRSGLAPPSNSPSFEDYEGMKSENDTNIPISALGKITWDAKKAGEFELFTAYQRLNTFAEFSAVSVLSHQNHYMKSNSINRLDYRVRLLNFAKKKKIGKPASVFDLARGKRVYTNELSFHTWAGITRGHTLDGEELDIGSPIFTLHRNRDNLTWEAGGEFTYQLELSSLLVGVDYLSTTDAGDEMIEIDRETNERTARNVPEELEYSNVGVFGQAIIYPFKKLGLTAGVRYDNSSQWGSNTSMRFGAVANIVKGLYIKGLYGTSFVPPSPTQLGAMPLQMDRGVEGNPDLNSQHAQTPEAAIVFNYWKPLRLQVTFFYTKVKDRVEFVQTGRILKAENLTDSRSIGGTFSADFNWRFFFAKGDVSFQNTEVKDPEITSFIWETVYADDIKGGRKPPNFPDIIGHLNLGVRFPKYYFQIAALGTYVGPRKSSYANIVENGESYMLDRYVTLGAHMKTVGLEIFPKRETIISVHGSNLTNSKYVHGGAMGIDIPALGPSVFLKIAQEI